MRRTDTQRLGPHLLFAALGFSVILAPRGAAAQDTQAEEAGEAVQQVRLEVTLLEWRLNNTMDFDFAVRFTGRPGSILGAADLTLLPSERLSAAARLFLTGLDTGHGSFDVVIEALETVGKTTVLSESEVIVPVGEAVGEAEGEAKWYSARVSSGTRIPFESVRPLGVRLASTTEYQDTGITLECTIPAIKYGDLVHLDLRATVTDSIDRISVGLNEAGNPLLVPVIDNREMISEILVRSGSIFIAGLLKSSSEIELRQGIPFISELPFLRRLLARFSKSNEVTELVFLVRPQILPPIGASAPQTPEEPEASPEASSDQSRPWRSDPDAHMIAIDALVIEVNALKTRDLGLHYGLDSNDPSNILEGIDIGLENPLSPVAVPSVDLPFLDEVVDEIRRLVVDPAEEIGRDLLEELAELDLSSEDFDEALLESLTDLLADRLTGRSLAEEIAGPLSDHLAGRISRNDFLGRVRSPLVREARALGLTNLGFRSQLPGIGATLTGMDVNGAVISARLRALLGEGEARILNRSIIHSLNQKTAKINIGRKVPYQDVTVRNNRETLVVTSEEVGVSLEITPTIIDLASRVIELDITKVKVTSVSRLETTNNVERPVFNTAETRTRITINDGETFQLSRLRARRDTELREGIPILMHIPLLGPLLFSSHERVISSVDILFFITPHIVEPGKNVLLPFDFLHGEDLIREGVSLQVQTESLQ